MKLQSGPAFGAAIIGVGFAYLLHRSGKPLGFQYWWVQPLGLQIMFSWSG